MVRVLSHLTFVCVYLASTMVFAVEKKSTTKSVTTKATATSNPSKKSTTAATSTSKTTAISSKIAKQTTKKAIAQKKSKPLFKFLTFMQVAKLEHTQRVKYIRALRQAMIDLEKTQNMYRLKSVASLDGYKPGKFEELYAFVFGQWATAEETMNRGTNTGTDGEKLDSRCIHSYNLQFYPRASQGSMQKFLCPKVPCLNGSGSQCGKFMSGMGLTGESSNFCISDNVAWNGTQECEKKRIRMADDNDVKVNVMIDKIRAKFTGNVTRDFLTGKADADGETAGQLIKQLADLAYSDDAYAQLIYILALYKKNDLKIPNMDILRKHFERLNPEYFTENFDNFPAAVNEMFGEYLNHCNLPVAGEVIVDLDIEARMPRSKLPANRNAYELEQARIEAVANYKAQMLAEHGVDISKLGPNEVSPACTGCTNKNLVEIRECAAIQARVDSLKVKLEQIENTCPDTTVNGPPTTAPVRQIDSSQVAPIYDLNLETGTPMYTKSTGCNTDVTLDKDQLEHAAPRCMACLAERSMYKLDRSSYSVSTKWLSLMSTVVLACGDGISGSTHIQPKMMLRYMQTFGHCSANSYDWDPGHCENTSTPNCGKYVSNLTDHDRQLIRAWNDRQFWRRDSDIDGNPRTLWQKITGKPASTDTPKNSETFWKKLFGDKPSPDGNGEFERIYGISYAMATEVFCDPSRFKDGWLNNRVRDYNMTEEEYAADDSIKKKKKKKHYTRPDEDTARRMGRAQFKQFLDNDLSAAKREDMEKKSSENPQKKALLKCMDESLQHAEQLYSGTSGKNTCMQMVPAASVTTPMKEHIFKDINENNGTTTISNIGICYPVSIYQADSEGLYATLGADDPSGVSEESQRYNSPSAFTFSNKKTTRPKMVMLGPQYPGLLEGLDPKDYDITYPNDAACSVYQQAPAKVPTKGWMDK